MLERGYVIIIAGGILVTTVIVYQEYGLGLWPVKLRYQTIVMMTNK